MLNVWCGVNNLIVKFSLILLLFCVTVMGCEKNSNEGYKNFEIYYQDTLDLSELVTTQNPVIEQQEDIFGLLNKKLFVKNFPLINRVLYNVKIDGENYSIKLRYWMNNKYKLEEVPFDHKIILLTKEDTTFYFVGRELYYSVGDMSHPVFCALIAAPDMIYNEMVAEHGKYAIRLGNTIYISSDLKKWALIYHGLRGIKESMVIVQNRMTGVIELVFSEYTPGTIRRRHHVQKYNFDTGDFRNILTFYTTQEHIEQGLAPYARHIHVLSRDPYTGDLYLGTGDTDNESRIYVSSDDGETFRLLGTGSQKWRTLTFLFTEKSIFWNMDSHETQYIRHVSREQIEGRGALSEVVVNNYPLINSALWCVMKITVADGQTMYVMTSNNEGGIYDQQCRTYGIILKNEVPFVYELLKVEARTVYTQMFPIGVDNEKNLYFCDHEVGEIHKFKLTKYNDGWEKIN